MVQRRQLCESGELRNSGVAHPFVPGTQIAEVDGMTTNLLISQLYEEVMDYRGEVLNFASFLRAISPKCSVR